MGAYYVASLILLYITVLPSNKRCRGDDTKNGKIIAAFDLQESVMKGGQVLHLIIHLRS